MTDDAGLKEYDTVRIRIPAHLTRLDRDVEPGTEGVIVDISTDNETGRKGYTVEFAFANEALVGDHEFGHSVFTADQLERV